MKPIKNTTHMSDAEINKILLEIAVERGLAVPRTPEEVVIFEKTFAGDIREASKRLPSLVETLALAGQLNSSNGLNLTVQEPLRVSGAYQMAARNGSNISEETLSKIDKALKDAKENDNDNDE